MYNNHGNGVVVYLVTLLAVVTLNFGYLTQADHNHSEDTYLEFLDKESNFRVMRRCDDCNSDAIDLSDNPVPFGEYYHSVAHVATNGLISFGGVFVYFNPVPFSNESIPSIYASFVAAPYWADIDNSYSGEIWYETHTTGQNSTGSNSLLKKVSEYLRKQHSEPSFNASWMLVATWNESFPYFRRVNASIEEHNTFQGIVVTNGTKTYAVYTYHCDDITWAHGNRTVIGFNAGGTFFANHPLSSSENASNIDCESFPASMWHNVVYDVNPGGSNSSISPPLGGSCVEAGFTECCQDGSVCTGSPTSDCYCDVNCHVFGDCCYDIEEICSDSIRNTHSGNDTYLIAASLLLIYHISIDGMTAGPAFQGDISSHFVAVDYDYRQQYIYFSDVSLGQIARISFNGSSTEILLTTTIEYIEDIAVDWITNNLYWTDTLNRRLEVLDLDSNYRTELLKTGAHTAPRAIVVDPSTRNMYWTDWGEPAKIERASMDGTNREVLHDTRLVWPNGLAIDYQLQRLYWADAFTDRIGYSSVDGTGREILLTVVDGLHHPFSLTISGDQIYWTDWSNFTVYTAHKQSAMSILPLYENFLFQPNGIVAVDPNRQWTNITNYCEGNSCSHLCLLSSNSPSNYTCACPEGSMLTQDGMNCRETTNMSIPTPESGSCVAAGFTGCCNGGLCAGYPPTCFCELDCEFFGDCCDDFYAICLNSSTPTVSTIPLESTTSLETTPPISTTSLETTTPVETTTLPISTTSLETTPPTETTTPPISTTPLETTPPISTTPLETTISTTPLETTPPAPISTTLMETTTPPITSTTIEKTTPSIPTSSTTPTEVTTTSTSTENELPSTSELDSDSPTTAQEAMTTSISTEIESPSTPEFDSNSPTTTQEPTENIGISTSSKIQGGAIAAAVIVVVLLLVLLSIVILGLVWIVRKKKKHPQAYTTFDDSETIAITEFKPRLDTYEQKNELGNDKVSYEAVGEKVHLKPTSEDYTAL